MSECTDILFWLASAVAVLLGGTIAWYNWKVAISLLGFVTFWVLLDMAYNMMEVIN